AEVSSVFGHTPHVDVGDNYEYDSFFSKGHEPAVAAPVCTVIGEKQKLNVVYAIFKAIHKGQRGG
ncbi:hypothetical protein KXX44_009623, partial [Aspergillus fumigatus]